MSHRAHQETANVIVIKTTKPIEDQPREARVTREKGNSPRIRHRGSIRKKRYPEFKKKHVLGNLNREEKGSSTRKSTTRGRKRRPTATTKQGGMEKISQAEALANKRKGNCGNTMVEIKTLRAL